MKDKENNIVVRSKIKDLCEGMSVSSDFGDVLNDKVTQMVKDAVGRAKANNRRTVMSKDL